MSSFYGLHTQVGLDLMAR